MTSSLVRIRLLAAGLLGFRPSHAASGWNRSESAKVGSNPIITAPSTASVTQGQATAITGVSISDAGANTFTMTLHDTNGLLSATGTGVSGSGTTTLTVEGTLNQVNADLATLTDTEPAAGNDTISLSGHDELADYAAPRSIAVTVVACYLRGTMIATPDGERPIESLAIGDLVLTVGGASRPIRWIGHRAYRTRFARCNPETVPIRIAADALDDGVPRRDLYVSPRHAMFLDGLLIQAMDLVDGHSIAECMPADGIAYFHIELAEHDVLVAEGAPSESFVDDESRMMFHNAFDYFALYPGEPSVPAVYCAPRVSSGEALEAIRRRLASRLTEAPRRAA